MKVIATKRGFFMRLREPGDVFEYDRASKVADLPSWMCKYDAPVSKSDKATSGPPSKADK